MDAVIILTLLKNHSYRNKIIIPSENAHKRNCD